MAESTNPAVLVEALRKEIEVCAGHQHHDHCNCEHTARNIAQALRTYLAPVVRVVLAEHPEDFCDDYGGKNPRWWADHALWNLVMGGPTAKDDPGGIVCPRCFMIRAEFSPHVDIQRWKLSAEMEAAHG